MIIELSPGDDFPRSELLARYLWPKFGNIYEYNLNGGDARVDAQEWTVGLKEAVTCYLLDELPANVAPYLFDLDAETLKDIATKREAVAALIARAEPWEVAIEVQRSAVKAVPTLDELIGHLNDWPSEDERADAEEWLLEHASEDVLKGLVKNLAKDPLKDPFTFSLYELTHEHRPRELLTKWHQAVGVARCDLTDEEWAQLVPLLPKRKTKYGSSFPSVTQLAARRRAYDGIRYRFTYKIHWDSIPRRYGTGNSACQRYFTDKKNGVFAHLAQELRDVPEVADLVAWLEQMDS